MDAMLDASGLRIRIRLDPKFWPPDKKLHFHVIYEQEYMNKDHKHFDFPFWDPVLYWIHFQMVGSGSI